ncbi:uncharacterized protein [Physcomitrium patens]|uniref:Uncharacterized protein n=1 Tax=Physcomitrium patens TaxID=3218 RepID=A9RN57_PHYPA|nr:uncharacterized protein LOC112276729 [Physcomitrium patens]PNR27975.1 hypothetical protein PHYPA_028567 [Physcomitrium patens]|eukprot:XP_024364121.1 uncharacterized protein LOC112276729 [Physcomitrella patens]
MRGDMATWLRVAAVVAVVCLVGVMAEQPKSAGEFVAVHRNFPRTVRVVSQEDGIAARGHGDEEHVDGNKMQWSFNLFKPFQMFGVRREGHEHKKCKMGAKLGLWWSHMFGHGRDHHHHHHRHNEHGFEKDVEHRHFRHHEHGYEHRFEKDTEHHHWLRPSFAWSLLGKIGRWFSGIPSFFSDMAHVNRIWSAGAGGRKPPTVESATEPLDMHALQKILSPSLSCSLREKLANIFAAVSEEIVATANGIDDSGDQPDMIKRNLKNFMGDSMKRRIASSVCDSSSMSSCEQEFCDVFLSHSRSGILMAFRVLGLNPVRAAINPEGVAACVMSSRCQSKNLVMSTSELALIMSLKKARRLARIVYQAVNAKLNEEASQTFSHKLISMFSKAFGGEPNPCRDCLRWKIHGLKKLTKKAVAEVCENAAHYNLEEECNFAKENKFIFKTLFAYKFRLWKKATVVCRNREACDTLPIPSTDTSEQGTVTEGVQKLPFGRVDINTLRTPREMEVNPMVANFMFWRQDCKQRALHRAAMLRGHSLEAIASHLNGDGSLSLTPGNGALIIVDFVRSPQLELDQQLNVPFAADLPKKWDYFHGTMNMEGLEMQTFEPRYASSMDLGPFHEVWRKPVLDSSPIHVNGVMEDALVKPRNNVLSITADSASKDKLPSSNEAVVEHSAM